MTVRVDRRTMLRLMGVQAGSFTKPQIHAAFRLFLLAVAVRAVRFQDRTHVLFKTHLMVCAE